MSGIGQRVDEVIRLDLAARLKTMGFRKRSRTFHLAGGDHVRVVNVQGSRSNAGDAGQFTVNLGVYYPEVNALFGLRADSAASPRECECTIRQRIGTLMPVGQDFWWSVESGTDVSALAREVGEAWELFGAPWLEFHADLHRSAQTLCRRGQIGHGITATLRAPM